MTLAMQTGKYMSEITMALAWMHDVKKANVIMTQHNHDDHRLPMQQSPGLEACRKCGGRLQTKKKKKEGGCEGANLHPAGKAWMTRQKYAFPTVS